jgi:hypothetical protein
MEREGGSREEGRREGLYYGEVVGPRGELRDANGAFEDPRHKVLAVADAGQGTSPRWRWREEREKREEEG